MIGRLFSPEDYQRLEYKFVDWKQLLIIQVDLQIWFTMPVGILIIRNGSKRIKGPSPSFAAKYWMASQSPPWLTSQPPFDLVPSCLRDRKLNFFPHLPIIISLSCRC